MFVLDGGLCKSCSKGFFWDLKLKSCSICPFGCASCRQETKENNRELICGTDCLDGFGFERVTAKCKKCGSNCESCQSDSSICSQCSSGFVSSPTSGLCAECPANCLTCNSDRTCLKCETFFSLKNGECVTSNYIREWLYKLGGLVIVCTVLSLCCILAWIHKRKKKRVDGYFDKYIQASNPQN